MTPTKCRKKRKLYLLGYVVGCIYPGDDGEWLFKDKLGNLCGWNGLKQDKAMIHATPEKAKKVAEAHLAAVKSSWQLFYRPYLLESPRPHNLPIHDGNCERILVGEPKEVNL